MTNNIFQISTLLIKMVLKVLVVGSVTFSEAYICKGALPTSFSTVAAIAIGAWFPASR